MEISLIILIIIGAIILFYATKFLSSTFKLVTKIMLIIIILLVIITVMIYKDLDSLKEGLYEGNSTFILYEEGKAYAAVSLKPIKNLTFSLDSFGYFTEDELDEMSECIEHDDFAELQKSNKMLFLMKPEVIDKPYNLSLIVNLTEKEILGMIISQNPYLIMAEKIRKDYNESEESIISALTESYGNPEKMKGYLFAAMLMNYFKSKDSRIIEDMREEKIKLIPEMKSVKVLKLMPGFIWN